MELIIEGFFGVGIWVAAPVNCVIKEDRLVDEMVFLFMELLGTDWDFIATVDKLIAHLRD
ncbi:hypothetical protein OROGR_026537 [Orobanche gracilis]